jgi:hypothetical protein
MILPTQILELGTPIREVRAAGDVNGDGYSDVIVGADNFSNAEDTEGRAFVFHGSKSGLSRSPAWRAEPDQADAFFGGDVAAAGDVNGDGYADVLVGASSLDVGGQERAGRAYLYLGSPTGLPDTPSWTADGEEPSANFGSSVSTAGDVNGDGFDDWLVTSATWTAVDVHPGRVFRHRGPSVLRQRSIP